LFTQNLTIFGIVMFFTNIIIIGLLKILRWTLMNIFAIMELFHKEKIGNSQKSLPNHKRYQDQAIIR